MTVNAAIARTIGPVPPVTVVRAGALGDFVVTVPALRALVERHGPLRFVGNAHAAALAPELFAEVHSIDDPTWAGLFDAPIELPVPPGDAVVLMRDPSVAGRLVARGWRVLAAGHPFPTEPGVHVAEHLLRIVGARDLGRRATLTAAPASPGRYAVLHPGSGSRWKNWPAERFAQVAHALAARGLRPVVVAGPADDQSPKSLIRFYNGSLALPELASLLAGAQLYLGNDSGVSHVAGALGTPTVAVFGATRAARWAPWGPRVAAVEPVGRCSLCAAAEERPAACRCVERVEVAQVLAAADGLVARAAA